MNMGFGCETEYRSLVYEGAALFESKEYAFAATCFWQAFRIRPGAPVVLFNIARTMQELNDPRCEDFYAAAASQGNVDAYYELARLCSASGRRDEVVGHLKAYLKGNPANDSCTEWARDTIRQLCPIPLLVWSGGRTLR
jgi:tetratricopeptide (TPR) repeat protein